MKYTTKIVCVILTICALSFVVSATSENSYVYEYPEYDLTIEFANDSSFSQDDRQMIADSIAYNVPVPQRYSLCWLLGHDLYIETVGAIYHKKSEYDPRCQMELNNVEKCENCDYVYARLADSRYISCCPPAISIVSLDD